MVAEMVHTHSPVIEAATTKAAPRANGCHNHPPPIEPRAGNGRTHAMHQAQMLHQVVPAVISTLVDIASVASRKVVGLDMRLAGVLFAAEDAHQPIMLLPI